jgi:hypothetical protein
MLGWPIWLTARASPRKRSTASGFIDSSARSSLIAARLPITGWIAPYTVPMPPSPILRSTRYSPTIVPGMSGCANGPPSTSVLASVSRAAGSEGFRFTIPG